MQEKVLSVETGIISFAPTLILFTRLPPKIRERGADANVLNSLSSLCASVSLREVFSLCISLYLRVSNEVGGKLYPLA